MNVSKKTKTLSVLSALSAVLLLSGCNTMPKNSSAGDTFKQSMKKSFLDADSYNFSITQKVSMTPSKKAAKVILEDAGYQPLNEKTETVSDSVKTMDECDSDYDEALAKIKKRSKKNPQMAALEDDYMSCLKAAAKKTSAKKGGKSPFANVDNKIKKAMTPERIEAINQYWLKPMTFTVNGAVDGNRKQVLMDYQFAYQPKNLTLAVNFPMLFDFNDMSISLDPALALPIIAPMLDKEIGTSWDNKWVKFTLPAEIKNDIPTDMILRSFTKAMELSYNDINNQHFSFTGADALAKELGAAQSISMKLPAKEKGVLIDSLLTHWVAALDKEAKKSPDAIKNPKQFNQFLDMAKEMTKDGLFSELFKDDTMQQLLGETEHTVYLGRSGHMIGMLNNQKLSAFAELINADVHTRSVMKFSNHNNAKFSFRPNKHNTIDGNALIEKFKNGDVKTPFGKKRKKKRLKNK